MFSSLLLVAALPLAYAVPTTAPSSGCAAVGIITARASTEAAGEGSKCLQTLPYLFITRLFGI